MASKASSPTSLHSPPLPGLQSSHKPLSSSLSPPSLRSFESWSLETPTRWRALAFWKQGFLPAFFSSAWHRAGAQKIVVEWVKWIPSKPSAFRTWKLILIGSYFLQKILTVAECFHTFVKGTKNMYEDLLLFCLQTYCRQVQGFLAGAEVVGKLPR